MFLATHLTPSTPENAGTIKSVCHCPGMHLFEIESHDSEGNPIPIPPPPFKAGDRATLVNQDGLTTGVWIDGCTERGMREFFPERPVDSRCWAIEVRVPERKR